MRYPVSGAVSVALNPAGTGGVQNLLGAAITTGRVLQLKSIWIHNSHATQDAVVNLHNLAADATTTAASQRFSIYVAAARSAMVDFPAPGLRFATGCCAVLDTTGGTVAIGECGGLGYEE